MISAEQFAQKIAVAVQKRRNSVVLTFQGKLIVFLNKFFPNLVDRLVFNNLSKEKKIIYFKRGDGLRSCSCSNGV